MDAQDKQAKRGPPPHPLQSHQKKSGHLASQRLKRNSAAVLPRQIPRRQSSNARQKSNTGSRIRPGFKLNGKSCAGEPLRQLELSTLPPVHPTLRLIIVPFRRARLCCWSSCVCFASKHKNRPSFHLSWKSWPLPPRVTKQIVARRSLLQCLECGR
jgi:hypothetical protein